MLIIFDNIRFHDLKPNWHANAKLHLVLKLFNAQIEIVICYISVLLLLYQGMKDIGNNRGKVILLSQLIIILIVQSMISMPLSTVALTSSCMLRFNKNNSNNHLQHHHLNNKRDKCHHPLLPLTVINIIIVRAGARLGNRV